MQCHEDREDAYIPGMCIDLVGFPCVFSPGMTTITAAMTATFMMTKMATMTMVIMIMAVAAIKQAMRLLC
jgi:hypothetical protein